MIILNFAVTSKPAILEKMLRTYPHVVYFLKIKSMNILVFTSDFFSLSVSKRSGYVDTLIQSINCCKLHKSKNKQCLHQADGGFHLSFKFFNIVSPLPVKLHKTFLLFFFPPLYRTYYATYASRNYATGNTLIF